ncbi:MAG TPA: glycosyltransferase family 2 protein [Baekduia sp.]|nr:glycosyltransferase family 2 protein [Baekduia sp.]
MGRLASYVLPLRWTRPGPIAELTEYLAQIRAHVAEIIVVDGSPPELFALHAAQLQAVARHMPPDDDLRFAMGKVNGVTTGIRHANNDRVVIADDDVRYDAASLRRTIEMLDRVDVVRPQNYFSELPWHARLDTARSLLNRVYTGDIDFPIGDFPGTLAVRRSAFLDAGGYNGDAMFENLELMRTVVANGGTVETPLDLYVARRPPTTAHFWSQRVRQAYDDFAVPLRMSAFLSVLPLTAHALSRGRHRMLLTAALGSILVAEAGRRQGGGTRVFGFTSALLAPVWIAERSVSAWLAVYARLRGGVPYGARRLSHPATSMRRLREEAARPRG